MADTFETMLNHAKSLRDKAFAADTEFLLFLVQFEESKTYELAGFSTFERCIKAHRLGTVERFAEFKRGLAIVGDYNVKAMGTPAVVDAGKIRSPEKQRRYVNEVLAVVKEHGFPPSKESSRELRQRIEPDPNYQTHNERKESAASARETEMANTIASLKEKLALANGRIRDLEREIVTLKRAGVTPIKRVKSTAAAE